MPVCALHHVQSDKDTKMYGSYLQVKLGRKGANMYIKITNQLVEGK